MGGVLTKCDRYQIPFYVIIVISTHKFGSRVTGELCLVFVQRKVLTGRVIR